MLTRRGGTHEFTSGRNFGIGGAPSSPPGQPGIGHLRSQAIARPHLKRWSVLHGAGRLFCSLILRARFILRGED